MEPITLKEAKARGFDKYFTGNPCKHGHVSERYVSNRECAQCKYERSIQRQQENPEKAREATRKWQKNNPEKNRESAKRWNRENPERYNEIQRKSYYRHQESRIQRVKDAYDPVWKKAYNEQYREENIDRLREYDRSENRKEKNRNYQKNNPQKFAAYTAKRKAAELQATPLWYYNEKDQIEAIYAKATRISQETGIPHHVDHIVPLQSDIVCGLHCYDNLQILEGSENQSKNNRFED